MDTPKQVCMNVDDSCSAASICAVRRREVHEAFLLLGLLLEECLARGLKHHFKHTRPPSCQRLNLCHSHGMPSSHTSMMFCYLAVSSCLSLRHIRRQCKSTALWASLEMLACSVMAAAVAVSRVYLGYHDTGQVVAGMVLGLGFGVCWFAFMRACRQVYKGICTWWLSQQLQLKDTWDVADRLQLEHTLYAAAAHTKTAHDKHA